MKKRFLSVCVITAVFGYFFFSVEERSPTENLITDEKNQAVIDSKFVEEFVTGFDPGEILGFHFDTGIKNWFETYQAFSDSHRGILNTRNLFSTPYLDSRAGEPLGAKYLFLRNHPPPDGWCARAKSDAALRPFVMADCSGVFSFVFLPHKEYRKNELATIQSLVRLLEREKSEPFWKIWAVDISYAQKGVLGIAWELGRYVIHWGLVSSTFVLWAAGLFLVVFPIFYLNFRSWKLAWIALAHIVVAFIWMRGAMGLLGIRESVNTLLAYSPLFICIPSFFLYTARDEKKYRGVIQWTAILAILGFACQFNYKIIHIIEMSEAAIIGIISAYILSRFSFKRYVEAYPPLQEKPSKPLAQYETFIASFVAILKRAAFWIIDHSFAPLFFAVLITFAGILLFSLATGSIKTETNPQDYVRGTSIDRAMNIAGGPAGPGREPIYLHLSHAKGLETNDPEFFARAIEWLDAFEKRFVREGGAVRLSTSVLHAMESISCGERNCLDTSNEEEPRGVLGRHPRTRAEIELLIWPTVRNSLGSILPFFWHENGIRVVVGVDAKTDAELKKILDEIRAFNALFTDVRIIPFGRNVIFAELGTYLTWGNIINKITSNGMIALFVFMLVIIWQWNGIKSINPLPCGIASIVPFVFSLSVFLLVMLITGKSLDAVSSSISALAISAAGDFQLYFLRALIRNLAAYAPRDAFEKTFDEEAPLIVRDAVANAAGFLSLLCAFFAPVRELGFIMFLSTILCLIGTLVFMPPVLALALVPKLRERMRGIQKQNHLA